MGIIVLAYPNYDKFKDDKQVKATVDLWATMFSEDDAGIVGLAVRKHIATNKWPPSVAELREIMVEMTAPDLIPPDKAWLAVSDFISANGEYGGDSAAIKALPPLIARVICSVGYHNLYEMNCGSYRGSKPGMARTAFMSIYEPLYNRERSRAMTPASVNRQMDYTADRLTNGDRAKLEQVHQAKLERDAQYERLYARNFAPMIEDGTKYLDAQEEQDE